MTKDEIIKTVNSPGSVRRAIVEANKPRMGRRDDASQSWRLPLGESLAALRTCGGTAL